MRYELQTKGLVADSTGQVGVGTTAPATKLDVKGTGDTSVAAGTPVARFSRGNGNNFIAMFADSGGNYIVADDPNINQKDLRLQTRNNKNILLEPNGEGNVGVGAPSPTAKLEVHGDIRLGASGEFRAASGEENLRIIRGQILDNGDILQGTGFTCVRLLQGHYLITFDVPFADAPSVTAIADGVNNTAFIEYSGTGPASIVLCAVQRSDGSFIDKGFCFIAIGSR